MSAVELIAAALAAGAGAGLKDTTSTAVHDAYAGLKRLLRPWMRDEARLALDADETESEVWQLRLRVDLTKSGAVDDDAVLAAARRLLALADLERARTFNINVDANHGAIGEFHAPVTFNQSLQEAPVPPTPPAVL
ncbi:hypothetical protein QQG74_21780 [Micromonospora sp. FIMYZ51]|uniref:hypothetical protein n=1 Tax=Micromonospora sp. FIMYZ51 TaxID=3051832 RepID=UPI00311D4903